MYIKIFLILIIAWIVFRLYVRWKKQDLSNIQYFSWLFIWLSAAVIIIWPQLTTSLAQLLGVGRGVDLVIYVSVIILFYLNFRLLTRIEELEKNLTKLTRHLALKDQDHEKPQ